MRLFAIRKEKIRSRIFTGSILVGVASLAAVAAASVWALSGDISVHDPGIYKEGTTWWMGQTYDTGIGVKYSSDGHNWTQGVPIFGNGLAWWGAYNGNTKSTWAAEFARFNNKTLCYYSVSTFGSRVSAIGLATATTMQQGNWVDQGAIITSNSGSNFNAIDPSFVVDASGNPWLTFGSWNTGIYITRVSTTTFKPTGSWTRIASASGGIEAPTIVRNGSYYYLFVSKGTCCDGANSTYHIEYGRSSSITGPYLDKNGVNMLSGGGTTLDAGGTQWKFPGGQSIINNGGSWVIARHEKDAYNNYYPVLFINDLYWSNGWPTY